MAPLFFLALLATTPSLSLAAGNLEHISVGMHQQDFHEEADEQERAAQLMQAFAEAQNKHEETEVPHVAYSSALLEGAQELLKKHASALTVQESDVKAALEKSGSLRDSIAAHMEQTLKKEPAISEQQLLLFDRARRALPGEAGALLEKTVARKDQTPCVHVLENAFGYPLADFDAPGNGMGTFWDHESCTNGCLQACKQAFFSGRSKFGIEPNEMAAMGMSQREISLVGGMQQIGAKCDGQMCRCLDATETNMKVMQMFNMGQRVDLTKDEPFEAYPSEMQCMDYCHDEQGIMEGYGVPVVFQGVCFDEATMFGS